MKKTLELKFGPPSSFLSGRDREAAGQLAMRDFGIRILERGISLVCTSLLAVNVFYFFFPL